MNLTGTVGPDWLLKHGMTKGITDSLLRDWRDHLEEALRRKLSVDADFSLSTKTVFRFLVRSETHTIVEIESFARRELDNFLAKQK
jgi:hypothetical protein